MNSIESIAKSLNIQHFRYASIYLGFKMSLAAIELVNVEEGGGGVRQNKLTNKTKSRETIAKET